MAKDIGNSWKDIPGWKGFYQANKLGQIKSLRRKILLRNPKGKMAFRTYKERILKPGKVAKGYPLVSLIRKGARKYCYVHDLILLTFKGRKPKRLECCHNDGTRSNNALSNLRYGTRSENALDRNKHGTTPNFKGENAPSSKLTEKLVIYIRTNPHISGRKLAKKLGVSHNAVTAARRGASWRHVK